ncbi:MULTISPECIES: LuxR C-terminal-related transcriptional regulator [Clostridium]|uniref:LuxR C-terminal-related transcriptional regulator n=1 Tax=Clostridium TaxID=1485 RepID=UPI000824F8DF|nr:MULTISPECIES: LuxR C-terminal-related transcriptional regulator [Clostridium]PJI08469.1 helix-turn-helix transcriptional regulator [Clostridium sp. CT7]
MKNEFNLIRTKLIAPIPRKNYIKREGIINELKNIFDYKITIVKGAAGSGKSTLLSSFIKDKKLKHVKWINLDSENNEIYSFWYYFIEAISDYLPGKSEKLINNLNGMANSEEILEIISYMINKLCIEEDILIVFDDYHHIKDKNLNLTVKYLIKYSPQNVHYAFLTREEFPIYLGELRVRDELLEINETELRFSKAECSDFMHNTLKLDISEEDMNKIFNISEGWIGGLQFTALALKNKGHIEKINVLNKYVIEYLTEEILKGLNSRESKFLIKTSILKYFNSDLTDYVLEITDSTDIINSLVDKNLFIITLNEEENVFRYHHLFNEFLNISFNKLAEEEKKVLHLRAYNFLKENGDVNESIRHLFSIKAYEKAIPLIEKNISDPKSWIHMKELPLENLITSNELIVQRIFYHFSNLQVDECKDIINYIEKNGSREAKSLANMSKIYVYNYCSGVKEEDLKLVEKLKLSEITKAVIYLNMQPIFLSKNEYEKVIKYAVEADKIAKKHNMFFLSVFAKCQIAIILEDMGEYSKVMDKYKDIKILTDKSGFNGAYKSLYYLGVAGIYMKRYEIAKSEKCLKLAAEKIGQKHAFTKPGIIYNEMELRFIKHEFEEGKKIVDGLSKIYVDSFIPLQICTAEFRYMLPMKFYQKEDLHQFKSMFEKEKNYGKYIRPEDKIVYSRVLYLLSEKHEAIKTLDEVLEFCRKYSIITNLIDGIIVKIMLLKEDFELKKREIYNLLRESLHYSIKNEYLRVYVIEGKPLLNLIKKLKNDKNIELTSKEKEFIQKIIDIEEPNETKKDELLSEREKEVLSVLCEGHSNKEIGEILNISLATVKTHILNIYSKLQVSNRVQAVEKAKKVGLK